MSVLDNTPSNRKWNYFLPLMITNCVKKAEAAPAVQAEWCWEVSLCKIISM